MVLAEAPSPEATPDRKEEARKAFLSLFTSPEASQAIVDIFVSDKYGARETLLDEGGFHFEKQGFTYNLSKDKRTLAMRASRVWPIQVVEPMLLEDRVYEAAGTEAILMDRNERIWTTGVGYQVDERKVADEADEAIIKFVKEFNDPEFKAKFNFKQPRNLIVDEGRAPEPFLTIKQSIEKATNVLRTRQGIHNIKIQRRETGELRIFITTIEMSLTEEEKSEMIKGIDGVDLVFDPLRDVYWEYADQAIKEELAKWETLQTMHR